MLIHHWVFLGSLAFVVAACANSAHLTKRHLITSGPRDVRSFTVRILLMVPVYSIESWLALVLRAESDFNKVLALIRKGCESVVVISFVGLLLTWLGGPQVLAERLEPGCCRHLPPLSFVLPSWAPAPRFVQRTLTGVLQNALCSVVAVPVILLAWCVGVHFPKAFEIVQPFCLVLMNASQFFAVYCVVTFYHANREKLGPLRPVQKLLSIKGLVFCLFWQEAAIRVAERAGLFDELLTGSNPPAQMPGVITPPVPDNWTVSQVAWGTLNSMICVEMFLLSCLHRRLYPPGEATRLRHLYAETPLAPTKVEMLEPLPEVLGAADVDSLAGLPPTLARHPSTGSNAVCDPSSGGPLQRSVAESSPSTADGSLHVSSGWGGSSGSTFSGELSGENRVSPAGGIELSPLELRLRGREDAPTLEAPAPTPSTTWAHGQDDPALNGSELREVWRRLLLALDLSDIPRFYQSVSALAASHREPPGKEETVPEAVAIAGGAAATTRNRASSVNASGSGWSHRTSGYGGSSMIVI